MHREYTQAARDIYTLQRFKQPNETFVLH